MNLVTDWRRMVHEWKHPAHILTGSLEEFDAVWQQDARQMRWFVLALAVALCSFLGVIWWLR